MKKKENAPGCGVKTAAGGIAVNGEVAKDQGLRMKKFMTSVSAPRMMTIRKVVW